MTVSSTTIKKSHSGDGSTTVFPYTFKIFAEDDITVILRNNTTGAESVQGTSLYSVSGVGNANGGNVTFNTAPTSNQTVLLRRESAQTQTTDYVANDPFPAATHEDALDKLTFMVQEQQETLDRAIKVSRTNTITSPEFTVGATDRANKVFAFDSNGNLSVTQEIGTFRGTDATTTTSAYKQRDLIKSTTAGQLNNVYICVADSVAGDSLTDTGHFELVVDAVSAATSATNAASSASDASGHATTATTKAGEASTSAAAAAASLDSFTDIYLGEKSSEPTVDNDGDALTAGDLYFNTTSNRLFVYNGSSFQSATPDLVGDLSPQLGGNLDLNSNNITGTGNVNITGTITSSGDASINGITAGLGNSGVFDNVAFGVNALSANTVGNQNVAVGYHALKDNTSGQQNVAVGDEALTANLTGLYNVAIGSRALRFNDSGRYNISLGYESLKINNSGDFNVGIGAFTLESLTTGHRNIAIGKDALDHATDADDCIAIGTSSVSTTAGDYNIGIGFRALRDVTGTTNTAVGHEAGLTITTGNYNTVLGSFNANENGIDIRTTDNNIVISDGSGNPKLAHLTSLASWAVNSNGEIGRISGKNGGVSIADDSSVTLTNSNAGACLAMIYESASGNGALVFFSYTGSPVIIQQPGTTNFAVGDTDGKFCIIKSAGAHACTFKNRIGSTKTFHILIVGGIAGG